MSDRDPDNCTCADALICGAAFYAVVVVLVLSLGLGVGTEWYIIRSSEVYALTDNRLISYRGDFCVNLRASSTQETRDLQSSATLAFLRSRPPLTGREVFNLSGSASLNSDMDYKSWNFSLNYNSNASIEVCYQGGSYSVTFHIIKSTAHFNAWVKDAREARRPVRSVRLKKRCTSISYRVRGDGVHYFVLDLNGRYSSRLNIDFDFNRTVYEVSSDMVVKNCSFPLDGRSGCTLDAPMTPGYTGFLSLNTNPPVDYNDRAGISISCSPRGWLFAVIVLVVVFVTLCLPCTIVTIHVITLKKRNASTVRSRVPAGPQSTATPSDHRLDRDEPSAVTNESIQLRESQPREHYSFSLTKSVKPSNVPSNVPADSALSKEEPPSYSDAAEYSNVESNGAPPPSYGDS